MHRRPYGSPPAASTSGAGPSPATATPAGRDGYRRWRTDLGRFHAETAAEILREVGYDGATVTRVEALLRKERLKADPDVQLLEDVICLVFLQHYLADFAAQHDDEKLTDILRKTWRKMSDRGRAAAREVDLPDGLRALVARAVGGSNVSVAGEGAASAATPVAGSGFGPRPTCPEACAPRNSLRLCSAAQTRVFAERVACVPVFRNMFAGKHIFPASILR